MNTRLVVVTGDLTTQEVDAIVNAANPHLQHGGGVAGAIVRAGGFLIQEESDAWVTAHGPLTSGVAAVTTAGDLPARWVVHVAGPVHREGEDNAGELTAAVTAALDTVAGVGARTVAMPAISTGIYGYPLGEATEVIVTAVRAWLGAHDALDEVRLVGFDEATATAFRIASG